MALAYILLYVSVFTDISLAHRWLVGLSVQMVVHKGEWTLEDEVS